MVVDGKTAPCQGEMNTREAVNEHKRGSTERKRMSAISFSMKDTQVLQLVKDENPWWP